MELNRVYSIAIHEKMALSPTVANSDDDDGIYTMPPEDDDSELQIINCMHVHQLTRVIC